MFFEGGKADLGRASPNVNRGLGAEMGAHTRQLPHLTPLKRLFTCRMTLVGPNNALTWAVCPGKDKETN